MKNQQITFTIIIPVYNEEVHLEKVLKLFLENLASCSQYCNIVIVNDGSTDDSKKIIQKVITQKIYPGSITSIHMPINRGIGAAYKEALKIISTDFVTWIPSDGEIPLESLLNALKVSKENQLTVSYPQFDENPRSIFRYLLSRFYTLILNTTFRLNLKYYNGFTIYPTQSIKSVHVNSNRFAFNAEALIKVLNLNQFDCEQVPFKLSARIAGKSKAISLVSLKDTIIFYIRTFKDIYLTKRRSSHE